MKVFVIFYRPGYYDEPYVKGCFASKQLAIAAMKKDSIYCHSKEGLDFDIEKYELNELA
jgi:hypothetical protein